MNGSENLEPDLSDYEWLVGPAAAPWLAMAAASAKALPQLARRLRRELPSARARLVLELVECRRRAAAKFPAVRSMFFTRQALEQATGWAVACYKAERFAADCRIADLCCGIGGDLLALAGRSAQVLGVERHRPTALLAAANCRAQGHFHVVVETSDAASFPAETVDALHIDPDRRPGGRRTTALQCYEPDLDAVNRLIQKCPSAAVKLAPAAQVPEDWRRAELQWISDGRECKQLVAWFGALASHPGRRAATRVAAGLAEPSPAADTFVGEMGDSPNQAELAVGVGRYVFEPDPAVLAARLAGQLAARRGLALLTPGGGYLTGDAAPADPLLTAFEVLDVLPLDVRRLKAELRRRGIGRLEIKQRGSSIDVAALRRQLRAAGEASAVLLMVRLASGVLAIVARRRPSAPSE